MLLCQRQPDHGCVVASTAQLLCWLLQRLQSLRLHRVPITTGSYQKHLYKLSEKGSLSVIAKSHNHGIGLPGQHCILYTNSKADLLQLNSRTVLRQERNRIVERGYLVDRRKNVIMSIESECIWHEWLWYEAQLCPCRANTLRLSPLLNPAGKGFLTCPSRDDSYTRLRHAIEGKMVLCDSVRLLGNSPAL